MAHMKFAPITSVDIKQSFLRHKTILADNHRFYNRKNIKQHPIILCYNEKQSKNMITTG